jgi:hypothetical protein
MQQTFVTFKAASLKMTQNIIEKKVPKFKKKVKTFNTVQHPSDISHVLCRLRLLLQYLSQYFYCVNNALITQ